MVYDLEGSSRDFPSPSEYQAKMGLNYSEQKVGLLLPEDFHGSWGSESQLVRTFYCTDENTEGGKNWDPGHKVRRLELGPLAPGSWYAILFPISRRFARGH